MQSPIKQCWAVFLLGSASYLPGILVLAHTIAKYRSRYPLIVLHNAGVPEEALNILRGRGLEVRRVESLLPTIATTSIAERFVDTWTKVQVFGLTEYQRVVLIDGDMMLRRNIDELFLLDIPPGWIACAHGCICNLDKSWWAPQGFNREACGYTGLRHPSALTHPAAPSNPPRHEAYHINSGLIVLEPSTEIYGRFLNLLSTTDPEEAAEVGSWLFPDQDFVGYVFRDRWLSLPWVYNAIKISRFWHGSLWRDEYAANVHYICGKPWREPPSVTTDGQLDVGDFADPLEEPVVDGPGSNTVTHAWWWQEYYAMEATLAEDALAYVRSLLIEPNEMARAYLKVAPILPPAL